jgi:hypothetical protein
MEPEASKLYALSFHPEPDKLNPRPILLNEGKF